MKLTSRAVYPVPAKRAYTKLADFDGLEALAGAYGAEITGRTQGDDQGLGRGWDLVIAFKGVRRSVKAKVTEVSPPERFVISADSEGILLNVTVTVSPQGDGGSEVLFEADVSARGLAGRLLLQPLKLAQGTLDTKFNSRVTGFTQKRLGKAPQS